MCMLQKMIPNNVVFNLKMMLRWIMKDVFQHLVGLFVCFNQYKKNSYNICTW